MAVRLNGQGAPDLAAVLRGAGLLVDESAVPDWRNRSRAGNTSWYENGRPTAVKVHHTASSIGSHDTIADERREANMLAMLHEVRPVSNLYLGPSGTWYPIAAGPSNTNGLGRDTWGGGVPDDAMNSYAVAIEAGNNGVGEPWPQLHVYVLGCAALCKAYGIRDFCVRAHKEWAPTRKIDPACGPTPSWVRLEDRYGTFNMTEFRRRVAGLLVPPPPAGLPVPTPDKEAEMLGMYDVIDNPGVKFLLFDNGDKIWVANEDMFRGAQRRLAELGKPTHVQTIDDGGYWEALGVVKGPIDHTNFNEYGRKI